MARGGDWREIEILFDAAWEIPAAQRRTWLARQPARAALVDEVLALLDAAEASRGFLEAPEAAVAGGGVSPMPFARLGCWRVRGPLGAGGMGQVHEVERDDGQFVQRAALKLIDTVDGASSARFHHERQVLATLDHPGIARIIDAGDAPDGRPFMVMEFVDGTPIDDYCDRHAVGLRGRIGLVQQACDALAHAHARRVVHRDVTPSNLLVDAEGRTRLIDFGIAGIGGDVAGIGAMSWDYAAPELAAGGVVSTSTDVYGVAAVLYRLVSGRPPRSSAGASPLVAVAGLQAGIAPLSEVLAGQPRRRGERALLADLDAILVRALARDPADRLASVLAFRDELERALAGEVVEARASQHLYRLARRMHRARWWLASVAAIVLSLLSGIGVAVMHAREAERQRDEAVREQARLEAIQQAVFHMFRSAGEAGGGEVRASEVLAAAARRIDTEFADDPARGAPVMHALGELYFLLTDYTAAAPLLARLAAADPLVVDPALIAAARYDLAQVAYRQGRIDDAADSLALAQAFWLAAPGQRESRLLDSRLLESQLLRARGHAGAAVALLEAALPRRIAVSGTTHRETGILYNNLAVACFDAGDSAGARKWFAAARAVWRESGLEQSPDALNTLNNAGAVELAAGMPRAAEAMFSEALSLRERLYGESAATAALVSNLGKLKLQGGQIEAALGLLERAAAMAERYAGKGSLHHVAALAGLVEALLARGDPAAAEAAALAANDALADGGRSGGIAAATSTLALARVRHAQGRAGEAGRLLDRLEADTEGLPGAAVARLRTQAARLRTSAEVPAPHRVPGTAMPSP